MIRLSLIFISAMFMHSAWAEWVFSEKMEVAEYNGDKKVFHHLDATGRSSIASSGNVLALVWEDNRSGSPQIYMSLKSTTMASFSKPFKLSSGQEAYEPVVIAIGEGRFMTAWEQDGQIWARTISDMKPGRAVQLSRKNGKQVSLIQISSNKILAAWSKPYGRNNFIVTAPVSVNKMELQGGPTSPVDYHTGNNSQACPVLGKAGKSVGVIWEDRRRGHTTLLYSKYQSKGKFSKPEILNEVVKKSKKYGKGSGVTRVAVSSYGKQGMAAAWMDKRNRSTGYDIFAAVNKKGGFTFAKNEQVQDSFGDNIAQWNPAIAGNPQGDLVVAWYDSREDSMDILLSYRTPTGWSEDELVNPASGDGDQTNAVMTFDSNRNLHMVWIHQSKEAASTKLFYSVGKNQ